MPARVQVFGRRQSGINPQARAVGVGKAPRHEIAVGSALVVWRYGDLAAGLSLKRLGRNVDRDQGALRQSALAKLMYYGAFA